MRTITITTTVTVTDVEDQSRNGVRVLVHRSPGGSWVDASCQCFGSPWRTHSDPGCPNRKSRPS